MSFEDNLMKEAKKTADIYRTGSKDSREKLIKEIYNYCENFCLTVEDVKEYLTVLMTE